MKVAVYVDVNNLYKSIGSGRYLNYRSLYKYLITYLSSNIVIANAYGTHVKNESDNFKEYLKRVGFTPKFKKARTFVKDGKLLQRSVWGVGLTLDVVEDLDKFDTFILCSSDTDFLDLLKWVKSKDKNVIAIAYTKPKKLLAVVDQFIKIPKVWIRGPKNENTETKR